MNFWDWGWIEDVCGVILPRVPFRKMVLFLSEFTDCLFVCFVFVSVKKNRSHVYLPGPTPIWNMLVVCKRFGFIPQMRPILRPESKHVHFCGTCACLWSNHPALNWSLFKASWLVQTSQIFKKNRNSNIHVFLKSNIAKHIGNNQPIMVSAFARSIAARPQAQS